MTVRNFAMTAYEITNDIRFVSRLDYEKVLSAYVGYLSRRADVVSIYQLGEIAVPGISDIDLIVVLDDRTASAFNFRKAQGIATGSLGLYAFSHAPYVVNRATFRNLHVHFYAHNLRHLWGEELQLNEYPSEAQEFYDYVIALEAAIAQTFVFMRVAQSHTVFNLRSLLCNLNAIKHSVSTIRRWRRTEELTGSLQYIDRVNELRETWFEPRTRKDFGAIGGMTTEALHILTKVLEELTIIGRHNSYLKASRRDVHFSLLDVNVLLHFGDRAHVDVGYIRNPLQSLCKWPWVGDKIETERKWREAVLDISVLKMPSELFSIIGFWVDANGPVGRILADRTWAPRRVVTPECTPRTKEWLSERESSMNAYLQFLKRNAISGYLPLTAAPWNQRPRTYKNQLKTALNTYVVRQACRKGSLSG